MLPARIQRRRTKGWCSPDNTVYLGRPSIFGNPFDVKELGHDRAVEMFKQWLAGYLDEDFPELIDSRERLLARLPRLRGKNLSC